MRIPPAAVISASLGVAVCAFGATQMWHAHQAKIRADDGEPMRLTISAFELVDQDGKPVTESVLDGGYTVVSFIFTNCPSLCPVMTSTMAEAQRRLSGAEVGFLSLSLDAERDTPAAMKAFAESHNADFSNWVFATGDSAQTRRIVREDLMLVVEDEQENQVPTADGSTMANILHPTRMLLVGPDRSVVGMYSVMDSAGVDELVADLKVLLAR